MTPSATLLKVTMKVTGKDLEWLSVTGTSPASNAQSYRREILGTNWVLTGTCPSATITPITPPRFTASASGLMLVIAGQYQTYKRWVRQQTAPRINHHIPHIQGTKLNNMCNGVHHHLHTR